MINTAQFSKDVEFLFASPEEFQVRGRFSLTCMLRTLAALTADATQAEFVAAGVANGFNPTTCRIQFAASRREWADLEAV